MGCDADFVDDVSFRHISIHASRMGCDQVAELQSHGVRDFNPRIPYGMRLFRSHGGKPAIYFNPRIPYGMRLFGIGLSMSLVRFQSTHPVWDATPGYEIRGPYLVISIHASRMGCDPSWPS